MNIINISHFSGYHPGYYKYIPRQRDLPYLCRSWKKFKKQKSIFTTTLHYNWSLKTKKALSVTAVAVVKPSTTITLKAHLTDNNQLDRESAPGRTTKYAYRCDQHKDLVRKAETKAETKRRTLMFFYAYSGSVSHRCKRNIQGKGYIDSSASLHLYNDSSAFETLDTFEGCNLLVGTG